MKKYGFAIQRKNLVVSATIALLALAIDLSVLLNPSAVCAANSALRYYEGRDAAGAICTTENSPITVEREDLTFDVNFEDQPETFGQFGSVSAKYTFKNPSELNVKANAVFPIAYLFEMLANQSQTYFVKTDGETVESKTRFSYMPLYTTFSVDNVKTMCDDYVEDSFYSPDLKVYEYTYDCTASNAYGMLYLGNIATEKVILGGDFRSSVQNLDGTTSVSFGTGYTSFVFYALGEDVDFVARMKFYSDVSLKNETIGSLKLHDKKETTFKQLALKYFDEDYGVSEIDWYNAAVASVKDTYTIATSGNLDIQNSLFCWLEYDMTFAPNQTIVNEVVVPLYPSVEYSYSPSKYIFRYLCSPASTWAGFKDLNVRINTSAYLLASSGDFEKVEGGYSWHSDTLPENEIYFTLCTSENPTRTGYGIENVLSSIIILTIVEPLFLAVIGVVIVVCVTKSKRKNKKKNQSGGANGKNNDKHDKTVETDAECEEYWIDIEHMTIQSVTDDTADVATEDTAHDTVDANDATDMTDDMKDVIDEAVKANEADIVDVTDAIKTDELNDATKTDDDSAKSN